MMCMFLFRFAGIPYPGTQVTMLKDTIHMLTRLLMLARLIIYVFHV